jgi:sulfonate transport system ATP-binding protein
LLLVTHDVEEAMTLADRVLVLDGGRVAVDRPIPLDRPPRRGSPLRAHRESPLSALGVDR